jgi:tetratricopeptide (TPR) repeat protein
MVGVTVQQLEEMPEPELIRLGKDAWRKGDINDAARMLFAACDRLSKQEDARVPASALSLYAVCLAHQGKLKEAIETCRHALSLEPSSLDSHLNMARIYLRAEARKKAIEILDRGLAISPRSRELLALREELGRRRPPVIGFLHRDNPLNVALGKARGPDKKKKS